MSKAGELRTLARATTIGIAHGMSHLAFLGCELRVTLHEAAARAVVGINVVALALGVLLWMSGRAGDRVRAPGAGAGRGTRECSGAIRRSNVRDSAG